VFQFGDHEIPFALEKIERSRLYGYKEVEVLDEHGRRCELATLADDGRTVVGRGGIAMGYLSVEGQWCDRSQLTAVDLDGKPMAPIPSSFGAPIKLFDTVDVGVYLSHDIRLVYQLRPEGDASGLAAEPGNYFFVSLQLPRRAGGRRGIPVAEQRWPHVPGGWHAYEGRIDRPAAVDRPGGRGGRTGRDGPHGFRHDLIAKS
jgi:hypothetical protein